MTGAAAARSDSALGRLVQGLRARGMYDKVNLIVVSDHGMSQLSPDRVVYLDDVVDTASIRITSLSPNLMITPRDGDAPALLARIRKLPHVSAWLKADVPERLHYNEGRRITPVVAVADGPRDGIPLLTGRGPVEGEPAAYVCRGNVCDRPVVSPGKLSPPDGT